MEGLLSDKQRFTIGILDHTKGSLGGAQLVNAYIAANLSQEHSVEIVHGGKYSLEALERAFNLDLSKVTERQIEEVANCNPGAFAVPGDKAYLDLVGSARKLTRPYDLFIYSGHFMPPPCFARRGLLYCHFPFHTRIHELLKLSPGWMERKFYDRLVRSLAYRVLWRIHVGSYQHILANSDFTATWIQRKWGMHSEVVYPPVELDLPNHKKRSLIVSIGRFCKYKKQREQVIAFRQFLANCSGNWILCMIGFCSSSPEDHNYLELVRQDAQGLPIAFVVNGDRQSTCKFLAEAKLFWHTMGLGIDEMQQPQSAEHFGIVTVEAMRAGCVPIVINSGGQREIIEDGKSGFLCRDMDELVSRSVALSKNENLLSVTSEHSIRRSMAFTKQVFDARISSIVSRCLRG